jgi:hypothetical protein
MTHEDLLKEATDPATDPERLRVLAYHEDEAVQRAAWRNPSLPETVWRWALLEGNPEAWANPMAPLYVLAWDDPSTFESAARWATYELWQDPERCSSEGKALLAAKVQEGWTTSINTIDMLWLLGKWVQAKGNGSPEHREVVRILVRCVRTAPNLTDKDRQALDFLKTWCMGGEYQIKESYELAFSTVVKSVIKFSDDFCSPEWYAVQDILVAVERQAGKEARAEHERLLADLIRQEMLLPPVVA